MQKLLFIVLVAVTLTAGCKSKCRQMSEKMCDCAINSTAKTSCLQVASSQESLNPPTEADEATCAQLLDSCDCRLIDTPQGKVRCGLARPVPGTQ